MDTPLDAQRSRLFVPARRQTDASRPGCVTNCPAHLEIDIDSRAGFDDGRKLGIGHERRRLRDVDRRAAAIAAAATSQPFPLALAHTVSHKAAAAAASTSPPPVTAALSATRRTAGDVSQWSASHSLRVLRSRRSGPASARTRAAISQRLRYMVRGDHPDDLRNLIDAANDGRRLAARCRIDSCDNCAPTRSRCKHLDTRRSSGFSATPIECSTRLAHHAWGRLQTLRRRRR